ncbi:membrane dipeptidase [Verminephrobacter aporrectodeae subsp. tuberculatae]|uniref:dipeptidase n=1 Tax=Verminephrobacter aporrectodeae TaxID=1110389 RepID=UPI0002376F63|nr:dipeptidase [Verminephrobacter aporrectodeae]MCW5257549.1 membrane dipeptidase [Verminephrobacter aporrectodeae subsp. tuberculatae]MCW8165473.1 membrane dipeptidase [Verminephrobacter aporrectodeae subsp. tuberculatae]MCW8171200.1 membrane dipeptidase [Verminephrobacter aporrectodeae subsp. tuberculatae]
MSTLHQDALIIDGLIISKWERAVFEDMRKGGLSAANCTVSVWEDFRGTVANIARMKQLIRANGDLLTLARSTADIEQAKKDGRTAIVLGFQNAHAFEDQLGHVEAFHDMGVRVVQLCYNTQNLIGTGCYERDGGLSGYGHEVVAEMNRVGIMVDLSHVGAKTSEEAILASKQPVTYSHCLPAGLKEHPRNKSDAQLRFIADHGGFIGVTMFPPFLQRGVNATVDDYVQALDYVINLVGEDCVGIGTDFTQGYGQDFFDWLTHDKGVNRRLTEFGPIQNPLGIRTIGEMPNLTAAMERARWPMPKITKVMGRNWLRVFAQVWGA